MKSDKKKSKKEKPLSAIIIQIADYMYYNPLLRTPEIVSKFAKDLQRTERTVYRYIPDAEIYNKKRLKTDEKIKDDVRHKQIKIEAEKGLKSRNDALKLLWDIAEGNKPDAYGIRTTALKEIMRCEGWIIKESVEKLEIPKFFDESPRIKKSTDAND